LQYPILTVYIVELVAKKGEGQVSVQVPSAFRYDSGHIGTAVKTVPAAFVVDEVLKRETTVGEQLPSGK
jgi:hypothetical protein